MFNNVPNQLYAMIKGMNSDSPTNKLDNQPPVFAIEKGGISVRPRTVMLDGHEYPMDENMKAIDYKPVGESCFDGDKLKAMLIDEPSF